MIYLVSFFRCLVWSYKALCKKDTLYKYHVLLFRSQLISFTLQCLPSQSFYILVVLKKSNCKYMLAKVKHDKHAIHYITSLVENVAVEYNVIVDCFLRRKKYSFQIFPCFLLLPYGSSLGTLMQRMIINNIIYDIALLFGCVAIHL